MFAQSGFVHCESKIRRQIGVARFCCGLPMHILKTGAERLLCGLLKHILKLFFVKLIFKTFTLEISKKKGLNILPRPGIRSICLLFRSAHLNKTVFSFRNKLPTTSALSKKKIMQKNTKRFHFEIVIELKKFTICSLK